MTEIKAGEGTIKGTINGYAPLMVSNREMENLYAYLKEKWHEREQELIDVTCKAKHLEADRARLSSFYKCMQERLEARNRDLDRLADMLEGM